MNILVDKKSSGWELFVVEAQVNLVSSVGWLKIFELCVLLEINANS